MLASQTKLQESQVKLAGLDKSAAQALHAAEQRQFSLEERAKLAEQVSQSFQSTFKSNRYVQ